MAERYTADGQVHQTVVVVDSVDGGTGPISVEPLGQPSVARQVSVTSSSATVTLSKSCRRISMKATSCPMRYLVGTIDDSLTASSTTSHFIDQNERLEISVPGSAKLAFIRASNAAVDGAMEITELS